jgi:hypothetical protein
MQLGAVAKLAAGWHFGVINAPTVIADAITVCFDRVSADLA